MARKAPLKAPARRTGAAPAPAGTTLSADLPPPEVCVVRTRRMSCDGTGGALGHPRVYLEMGEGDFVECPYCDRRFVLARGVEGLENERLAPGVYEGPHGH